MLLPTLIHSLLAAIGVGLAGGVSAGLLGVSPGGALVVFSVLLLGAEQHVAQGLSLIAQVPPTSIAGIRRYWDRERRVPLRWLVLLAIGFLAGGIAGALAAGAVSSAALRWSYVAYLVTLDTLMIVRRPQILRRLPGSNPAMLDGPATQVRWFALLAVGAAAGASSGFLGIGGGLAVTVALSAGLKLPQHQAQMISLMLSLVPATIPAAYVYWHEGWSTPWLTIAGVILGLWAGTDLGARMANRASAIVLRRTLVGFVAVMGLYMAYRASV